MKVQIDDQTVHKFTHIDAAGCYKIADLGLAAAAMGTGCDDITEGDCRYLAKEVLRGAATALKSE